MARDIFRCVAGAALIWLSWMALFYFLPGSVDILEGKEVIMRRTP